MASFSKRIAEIADEMNADAEGLSKVDANNVLMLAGARQDALNRVIDKAVDPGNDLHARPVNDAIAGFIDAFLLPYGRICAVADANNRIYRHDVTEDHAFFQSLNGLEIGETVDRLIACEAGLNMLIADLQKKWDTSSYESQQLSRAERDANEAMRRIVEDGQKEQVAAWLRVAKAMDDLNSNVFSKIASSVNGIVAAAMREMGFPELVIGAVVNQGLAGKDLYIKGGSLGIPAADIALATPFLSRDPGMYIAQSLPRLFGPYGEALISCLQRYFKVTTVWVQGTYARQLEEIQRKFPNRATICVTFTQTRQDVDRFLREAGVGQAQAITQSFLDSLGRWCDEQPTEALKAEARAIHDPIKEAIQRRYERIANAFGVFVQSQTGKFTGAVSKETENLLIDTDPWIDRAHGWTAMSMDTALSEWRASAATINGLWDNADDAISDAFAKVPGDYAEPVTKALRSYVATLKSNVTREVEPILANLDRAPAEFGTAKTLQSIDRRPLQALLR